MKEGEKRIKLREIEDQILKLNNEDGNRVVQHVELSTGEKVYQNDIVSKTFKKSNMTKIQFSAYLEFFSSMR